MSSASSDHVPEDRHYYADEHLWAHHDTATGRVRVGIDTIGLSALGELAFIAIDEVGHDVYRGQAIGTLEAAKMTRTLTTPVSGKLVEVNEQVLKEPLRVNADPYGDGWIVTIEASSWEGDALEMISGDAIAPWAEAERARLETENATE